MKTVQLFQFMICSPSDCRDEKRIAQQAIEQLSDVFVPHDLVVRPVMWEDVPSQIGTTPQHVIDKSITDESDAFIFLFKSRVGGNGAQNSGTMLELKKAIDRWNSKERFCQISCFFIRDNQSASELDPEQIAGLIEARKLLQESGVLHFTVEGGTELQSHVFRSALESVRDWMRIEGAKAEIREEGAAATTEHSAPISKPHEPDAEHDDAPGILELISLLDSKTPSITSKFEYFSIEQDKLTARVNEITRKYFSTGKPSHVKMLLAAQDVSKEVISYGDLLEDIDQYLSSEVSPIFDILNSSRDFLIQGNDDSQVAFSEASASLIAKLKELSDAITDSKNTILNIPDLTKQFRSAKNGFRSSADSVVNTIGRICSNLEVLIYP